MYEINPWAKPIYVMAKTVGAKCNLSCAYCYYLEKSDLLNTATGMTEDLLEQFIQQYIDAQQGASVMFTWHGGEPLLRGLSFYKKAITLQHKYANGREIVNCIQTNGILLDDNWCRFFHDYNWLVGISIDGPQIFHDAYRKTLDGRPTHSRIMHGIKLLNKHKVEWNAMAVVNDFNADYPLETYHFFKDIGCRYIQFTPIVERHDGHYLVPFNVNTGKLTNQSISPEQWGNFLCTIFDEWVRNDVGEYFIQIFDSTLANWVGAQPGLCTMAKTCGHAMVIETNGDVYSCDHFVYPQFRLGNINEDTIERLAYCEQQQHFGSLKCNSLPTQCLKCNYLFACNGGCPKDRFAISKDGNPHLNYLCTGYQQFFKHVAPYMDFMKHELLQQRPASNIMIALKNINPYNQLS